MNIADWLNATARTKPHAPALFLGHEPHADYATFARRVRALAAGLRAVHGLGAGDRVAIFMKNRPEYLEILYAVWWLGAIVVPVNNKLHPREVGFIVENSEAALLFSDHKSDPEDAGPSFGYRECRIGSADWQALFEAGDGPENPCPVTADDTAWIFYTSGTTGRPKGVMLTHWNLRVMSLTYSLDVDPVTEDQASLYAAPISHGAGLYNFMFVRTGGRHVFPVSQGFDPAEIEMLAAHHKALVLFAAPTMVKRMIEAAKKSGFDGKGIRTIVYGGGPMYAADIDEALAIFGPRFVQIYGQAESPMTITVLRRETVADDRHPSWKSRRASVGIAQGSVEVKIARDGKDLPPGEAGEILVRGGTVMKGYWRNEKATADAIVDGWLHTGDIGRMDEDGYLTLTDRSKDLIISGGTNIYPREVEEVLVRHPAVLEVSVVGAPSAEWGEDVVAFVVLRDDHGATQAELEALCKAEIASFKKPKQYIFCADLPKNSYGKVLKTELRERLKELPA